MENVKFSFPGKVAVVTGSAAGLGRAMAVQFAKAGANVAICDLKEELAKETEKLCQAEGVKAKFYKLNITDEEMVAKVKDEIVADFGTVDILVNNAGVTTAPGKMGPPMSMIDIPEWKRLVGVNLIGTVTVTKAFAPIFKEKKAGKIVNISSQAAYAPAAAMPHYNASKLAIVSYTQSCSVELGKSNVNVNAVCPGFIFTNMYVGAGQELIDRYPQIFGSCKTEEDVVKRLAANTSLGRPQKPEDIAYAVLFLCSDAASEITGNAVIVDSGGIRR